MSGSIIANEIDQEYRRKKFYESRNKQKCKNKSCKECSIKKNCTEGGKDEEKVD